LIFSAEEDAMATVSDWKVPRENQPKPADYDYDLATAVAAVVGVRAERFPTMLSPPRRSAPSAPATAC
jgi:hypothetical protein